MGDGGGIDHPIELQAGLRGAEVVEQANAVAEKHRNEMDLKLVEQPRPEGLLNGIGAACDQHVPVAGGRPSLLECGFDPVGDERERGSALLCDGFTSVVGEDEHRNAERRVVPPPAVRIGVVLPRACSAAEHPPLPITTAPCAASDSFTTSSSAPVSPPSMP